MVMESAWSTERGRAMRRPKTIQDRASRLLHPLPPVLVLLLLSPASPATAPGTVTTPTTTATATKTATATAALPPVLPTPIPTPTAALLGPCDASPGVLPVSADETTQGNTSSPQI